MVEPTFAPVTLADLACDGRLLWLYCTDCGHEAEVPPASLGLRLSLAVPMVKHHLVCSQCGSRRIDSRPQLHARPLAEIRRLARGG